MGSSLATVIVAGIVSGVMTLLVTVVMQKTRNVTSLDVAHISAETAEEISQRETLQKQQALLNEERARLDAVRDGLEKGRSVEIGNLKLQVAALTEELAMERQRRETETRELKERIRSLESDLLQANIKIVRLQEGRSA